MGDYSGATTYKWHQCAGVLCHLVGLSCRWLCGAVRHQCAGPPAVRASGDGERQLLHPANWNYRPRPDGRRNEGAMTPSQAKPPFERQVCRMAERGPLADGIRLGNLGQKQRASSQGEAAGCSAMMAMPTSATPAPAISQRVSAMPSMMRNHSSATAMYMPP